MRSRKRLIEVIDGLNDAVVPLEQNIALRKVANLLEALWNPPNDRFVKHLIALEGSPTTSWYISGLLRDALRHLELAPWSGPYAP